MYRPARIKNPGRARTARMKSIPAPVRGWNARDPIADMDPRFAVVLDNWFPLTSKVRVRGGNQSSVTGVGGGSPVSVETLITYRPTSGGQKLFGFAGTAAYNFSTPGAVGAAVQSGLNNAQWQCTNFSTSGGNFLLCLNGADDMRTFDGTNWASVNAGTTPSITNVLTANLVGVHIFKERPFYIQINSLNVWYPAVQAFAGALTKFTLASVVKNGGYLVAMGSWSINTGNTIDDLAVFITSEGECAVYRGTDPASPTTWGLVGVYEVGKPIGRRCFQKFGNDLLIITTDGVVPASKAFVADRSQSNIAVTDTIQGAMASSVQLFGGLSGWQLTRFSEQNALVLNIPSSGQQYVMNTITKAWCRFTGWAASCFETFNGGLYFGALGEVRQAWTGTTDQTDDIRSELVSAFNDFGLQNFKQALMAQPLIAWDSNPAQILLGIDGDYKIKTPESAVQLQEAAGGVWDTATWDSGIWGGDLELKKDWYSVAGEGIALALHLLIVSGKANIELSATNVTFGTGGLIG